MAKSTAKKALKSLKRTDRLQTGTKQRLAQALVPKPLYDACRAQMDEDGLTWRDVVRWALVEYLMTKDPKNGTKVWLSCV